MNLPAILGPSAQQDLIEAVRWHEEQRGDGARFVAEVRATLARIAQMPELRRVVYQDARRAKMNVFPYYLYYRVLEDEIDVFAIVHNRRNPTVWQSRLDPP